MKLKRAPDLLAFFVSALSETESDQDEATARDFAAAAPPAKRNAVIAQAKALVADADFPIDEIGAEANRWFGDAEEGRAWLENLVGILEQDGETASEADAPVKDSHGAVLSEGDSVQVIKDLKVKGGSSDLKRGTLIKKIHLIGDPDHIECRVDGSTLVLKTCFLKKA